MTNILKLKEELNNLKSLFLFLIFFCIAGLFLRYFEYKAIQSSFISGQSFPIELISIIMFRIVEIILKGLCLIFLAFYFIRWMYLNHQYLQHKTEIYYLNHSSSSCIWSWFIPVLNLFYPLMIMREITEAFLMQTNQKSENKILNLWWLGVLIIPVSTLLKPGILDFFNFNANSDELPALFSFLFPGTLFMSSIIVAFPLIKTFHKIYSSLDE